MVELSSVSSPDTLILDASSDAGDVTFRIFDNDGDTILDVEVTGADTGNVIYEDVTTIVGSSGPGGSDTIVVDSSADTTWNLTGPDSGNVTVAGFLGITFSSIENLSGGPDNNDMFVFLGGSLSGAIDGGTDGNDTLDYSAYTTAVNVNLAAGTATGTSGVSNIENIIGGSGNDFLTGDDNANVLTGGPGKDLLTGGGGIDTVVETRDANFILSDKSLSIGGEKDTLSGIEAARLTGGAGDNTFNASNFSGSVVFDGGAGNDVLKGGSGDDILIGGTENDTLTGGDGNDTYVLDPVGTDTISESANGGTDTLDYSAYTSPVTINLPEGTATGTNGISSIENLIGANELVISGTSEDETIIIQDTGETDDGFMEVQWIEAGGGTYTLTFEVPADSLMVEGHEGADTIDVQGLDSLFSADLLLYGDMAGALPDAAIDQVIFSGNTLTHGGDVAAFAENISVNSGVTIDTTGSYGDITLSATAASTDLLGNPSATVSVTGAELIGGNIDISATSSWTPVDESGILGVSLISGSSTAQVTIADASSITAAGTLTIAASSTVNATAHPAALSVGSSLDAAVATTIIDSTAAADVSSSSAIAGGAFSLSAANSVTALTVADARASNGGSSGAGVAVSVISGDTTASLQNATVSGSSVAVDATSTRAITTEAYSSSGGSTASSDGSNTSEQTLAENDAATSEGDITVAAAVAVNTDTGITSAFVEDSTIDAGTGAFTILTTPQDVVSVLADGSPTTDDGAGGVGVGVGVAINVANRSNLAYIGGSTAITAGSLAIEVLAPGMSEFSVEAISGAGAGNVGVAGALAINIVDYASEAVFEGGAAAGDLTLGATNTVGITTKATSASEGGVGIGASVALTISDVDTRAEIEDTVSLANVQNLSLAATTTPTITTTAEAGAAGDDFAVGGAVAITVSDNTTVARVGTGDDTILSGALTLTASQVDGTTTTVADGTVAGGSVGVGAAIALAITTDEAYASTERRLTANGTDPSKIEATTVAKVETTAKASAAGAKEKEGEENEANAQKQKEADFATTKAGKGTGQTDDADASTSDGGVGIAAAIAINVSDITAEAAVLSSLTTGGTLLVHSGVNADVIVKADGQAVDPDNLDVGVGVAVAINVADLTNQAYIGSGVTVNSAGLTLAADMASRTGESTSSHTFTAEATSGAGAESVGVAGSVAINIVEAETRAEVLTSATVGINNGDFSLGATSESEIITRALPANGGAEAGVGIGASVAVAVIDNVTVAEVQDGAGLAGHADGEPQDVSVAATGGYSTLTEAMNGAAGDDVAVGAGVAVAVVDNDTIARIGTDTGTVPFSGNAEIITDHESAITTIAGASASGNVSVGVSVGVAVVNETVTASLARNLGVEGDSNGSVTVRADATVSSTIEATASAGGSKSSDEGGRDADSEAGAQVNGNSNITNNKGSKELPSANDEAGKASDQADTESGSGSSGVGVAAAVAVNVVKVTNTASIVSGADVHADGAVTVSARAEVDATANALGSAISLESESNNIAAAVGFSYVTAENRAFVGSGSVVKGDGITIEAVTPGTASNEFIVWGASAGGGQGDVGVAGSVGINIVKFSTEAAARQGSTLLSSGVLEVEAETDLGIQTLAAGAGFSTGQAAVGAAIAVDVVKGVGDDPLTTAYIAGNADAAGAMTISAETDLAPITFSQELLGVTLSLDLTAVAIAGGATAGEVGVGAAVVVNVFDLTTTACIGSDSQINKDTSINPAGAITLHAVSDTEVVNLAGSLGVSTGAAGVGVGLDVTIINKDTQAYIGSSAQVESGANIVIDADSSEDILSVTANVGATPGTVAVAGSVSVQVIDTETRAYIAGNSTGAGTNVDVDADGDIAITADGHFAVTMIAGAIGAGGTAGIGVANTTLVHTDTVQAYVGEEAMVTTAGTAGLTVAADSSEEIITIAASGGVAGTAAVVGAAVVNVLNETTQAFIGQNATINATNGNVSISANDDTDIVSVAGNLAAAGTAAVGVGADVGVITKKTEAFIDSNVTAPVKKDIIVSATSSEDITSVAAGMAVSSTVSIAMDASVHVFDLETRAFIGDKPGDGIDSAGAGNVHAEGNILVSAHDETDIDKIVGVLSISGTAGIGAAGGVTVMDKTTEAFIGAGAKVTADGKWSDATVKTGAFTVSYDTSAPTFDPNDAGGEGIQTDDISDTPDIGSLKAQGKIKTPELEMSREEGGENDMTEGSFSGERAATAGEKSGFRGLAVTATNKDDTKAFTVSIAGGTVGVAISAGVNVVDTTTQAYIGQNALVNEDTSTGGDAQSVHLAAGNDFYHLAVAGTLAAGVVGVAPAVDVTVLSNTTLASIGAGATVNAKNDVTVEAHAREEILLMGFGIAAGLVGVGGAVDVLTIDNTTYACIGANAEVSAGSDVLVLATDDTEVTQISGALAGGFVGVGASVGVMVINKDTQAFVDSGAFVDALGAGAGLSGVLEGTNDGSSFDTATVHGLVVQAQSSEDVFHLAVAGGVGFVGVSGGVGVTIINSDTQAYIGANSQINQTDDNAGANADQSVFVNASNDVRVMTFTGALAGGFVGVGGAVEVGSVKNDTSAKILGGAQVTAAKDVEVNALGIKKLDGLTVSGAGGVVGLTASVSVWSIGKPIDKNYENDEEGTSANALEGGDGDTADQDAADQAGASQDEISNQLTNGFSDDGSGNPNTGANRVNAATAQAGSRLSAAGKGSDAVMSAVNSTVPTVGTEAAIEGATITAGGNVTVNANENVEVGIITGGIAGGLVGVGAGVSVLSVAANATARASGTLSAGGNIAVEAVLNEDIDVCGFAGAAGFVGIGAAVVVINDSSTVTAYIGDNSNIDSAASLLVSATGNQVIEGETDQVSVGAVGGGASFVKIKVGDDTSGVDTSAFIGSNVNVGQVADKTVGSLNVKADSTVVATGRAFGLAGGIGACTANFSYVYVTPEIEATIGDGSKITTAGDVSVEATGTHDASATVTGIAVGVGAIGASVAKADLEPEVAACVGAALISAVNVFVSSKENEEEGTGAAAEASSSSGGLIAGSGASSTAIMSPTVEAKIEADATVIATADVAVTGLATNHAFANSHGISGGLVGVGASVAEADANGTTKAHLDGDVTNGSAPGAAHLIIQADSSDWAKATAQVVAGGGLSSATGIQRRPPARP